MNGPSVYNTVSGLTAAITDTSDTSVIAAQGSGQRIHVTTLVISNNHATTPTLVHIKDGSTTKLTVYAPAVTTLPPITLPTPLRLSDNAALKAANGTTGSSTYVAAFGYVAP